VTRMSARCQSLRPSCSLCQLIRPGSSNRRPATFRFGGYRPRCTGPEWLAKFASGTRAGQLRWHPRRDSLPLKNARAGHRCITGPRCLSPDTEPGNAGSTRPYPCFGRGSNAETPTGQNCGRGQQGF
jgi:hypothetical protein